MPHSCLADDGHAFLRFQSGGRVGYNERVVPSIVRGRYWVCGRWRRSGTREVKLVESGFDLISLTRSTDVFITMYEIVPVVVTGVFKKTH